MFFYMLIYYTRHYKQNVHIVVISNKNNPHAPVCVELVVIHCLYTASIHI